MKNPTLPVKTRILFVITLLFAAMASVQNLHAATITVTSTADSGAGTLRDALASASDGDTIDFSVTGTITLTSTNGELSVTDYYRQLLRLVYRFLFLLVAEERHLLFTEEAAPRLRAIYLDNYSVSRLRERAERSRRGECGSEPQRRQQDILHQLR